MMNANTYCVVYELRGRATLVGCHKPSATVGMFLQCPAGSHLCEMNKLCYLLFAHELLEVPVI